MISARPPQTRIVRQSADAACHARRRYSDGISDSIECEIKRNELDRFDLVAFDPYCQRSLNDIHRYNQCAVAIARDQNSFNTFQSAATNANALSNLQERMRCPRHLRVDPQADGIDLLIGKRKRFALHADDLQHTVGARYAKPIFIGWSEAGKNVAAEKWQLDNLFTVTPAVSFLYQRQITINSLLGQTFSNHLFVPRPSVNRIPIRIVVCHDGCRA